MAAANHGQGVRNQRRSGVTSSASASARIPSVASEGSPTSIAAAMASPLGHPASMIVLVLVLPRALYTPGPTPPDEPGDDLL